MTWLVFYIVALLIGYAYRFFLIKTAELTIVEKWKVLQRSLTSNDFFKILGEVEEGMKKMHIKGYINPLAFIIPWFQKESENFSELNTQIRNCLSKNKSSADLLQFAVSRINLQKMIICYFKWRIPLEIVNYFAAMYLIFFLFFSVAKLI